MTREECWACVEPPPVTFRKPPRGLRPRWTCRYRFADEYGDPVEIQTAVQPLPDRRHCEWPGRTVRRRIRISVYSPHWMAFEGHQTTPIDVLGPLAGNAVTITLMIVSTPYAPVSVSVVTTVASGRFPWKHRTESVRRGCEYHFRPSRKIKVILTPATNTFHREYHIEIRGPKTANASTHRETPGSRPKAHPRHDHEGNPASECAFPS